jgi:hypothetical protein
MSNAKFTCQDCGFHIAIRSRKRGPWESFVLPLFLLRPARCANCLRRVYCWVFVPLREPVDLTESGVRVRPSEPSPTSNHAA